jgi:hypothetical protein
MILVTLTAAILMIAVLAVSIISVPFVRDWRAARSRPDYIGRHARRVFVWPDPDPRHDRPDGAGAHSGAYDGRNDPEG